VLISRSAIHTSSRSIASFLVFGAILPAVAPAQSPATIQIPAKQVQIVLLGTGTPRPTPDQQGPSLAVIVGGRAYLVDAGTGIVRQANAAYLRGVSALRPAALDIAFLTHLHSDHTIGLPDLIFTPWVFDRTKPLELYGPSGTKGMAEHILEAYREDIQVRTTGLEDENTTGYKILAHEIRPGIVYQDENVVVKAFAVKHGNWKEALGYRFEVGRKSVVVSGDTSPSESVITACDGCDALVHEVYAGRGTNPIKRSMSVEQWMKYESEFHTSATELGSIAARAKAKMLILVHWTLLGNAKPEDMLAEIRKTYTGPILVGRDLDFITP
jgi:ribonuclease BN (tRNA processing enzyme)